MNSYHNSFFMRLYFLLLSILLTSISSSFSQTISNYYQKKLPTITSGSFLEISDNESIFIGRDTSPDFKLIGMDTRTGNINWSWALSDTSNNSSCLHTFLLLHKKSNGNYLGVIRYSCFYFPSTFNVFDNLFESDSTGTIIWIKSNSAVSLYRRMFENTDGTFWFFGEYTYTSSTGSYTRIRIGKLNSIGEVIELKAPSNLDPISYIQYTLKTSDGFLITGIKSDQGNENVVLKFDTSMNLMQSYRIQPENNFNLFRCIELKDSSYLIAMKRSTDSIFVAHIDKNFNLLNTKRFNERMYHLAMDATDSTILLTYSLINGQIGVAWMDTGLNIINSKLITDSIGIKTAIGTFTSDGIIFVQSSLEGTTILKSDSMVNYSCYTDTHNLSISPFNFDFTPNPISFVSINHTNSPRTSAAFPINSNIQWSDSCNVGPISVNELEGVEYTLFPVPLTENILNIRINKATDHEIHIYDITGKEIGRYKNSKAEATINIPVDWENGIYYMRLTNSSGTASRPFILLR